MAQATAPLFDSTALCQLVCTDPVPFMETGVMDSGLTDQRAALRPVGACPGMTGVVVVRPRNDVASFPRNLSHLSSPAPFFAVDFPPIRNIVLLSRSDGRAQRDRHRTAERDVGGRYDVGPECCELTIT